MPLHNTGSRVWLRLGVSKKTRKPINRENRKKNNRKNRTEKNRLNFWKNRPLWFGFAFINKKPKKPNRNETKPTKNQKKTEPNQKNRAKPKKTEPKLEKTEPNRFEPVFALKNWTEPKPVGLTWFRFGFGFFQKKNSVWLLFFIKTKPNKKWSPLIAVVF